MIEKLSKRTCSTNAVVVLDAGIATDDNLKLITEKGYKYLGVSRTPLKEYQTMPVKLAVLLDTKSKKTIGLKQVATDKNTDYYLEVKNTDKTLKEAGMKNQLENGFEKATKNTCSHSPKRRR